MADASILDDILKELKRAKKKHPSWPDHIVARAGIVCEEAGELIRECIQIKYEGPFTAEDLQERKQMIRKEAIHVAATAIRFLESIK